MAVGEDYVPVDANEIGIDRSRVNRQHQIELPLRDDNTVPSTIGHDAVAPEKKRDKFKKALHLQKDPVKDPPSNHESPLLSRPGDEPVEGGLRRTGRNVAKELNKDTMKGLIHHPADTINDKVLNRGGQQVAAKVVAKEIPHEKEKELLRAHDAMQGAHTEAEKLPAMDNLQHLLKERQKDYVRWTLDRHVTKLRILPRELIRRKPRSEFQRKNAQGKVVMDWKGYMHHLLFYYVQQYGGQYIGAGTDVPPPSKHNIVPNIERLLVASAPFQQIALTIRRVYKWESRSETMKYLIIYVLLWWFDFILCGILSAIVYFVVERRICGNTLEDLREDIRRAEDQRATALSLAEFIDKRGDEHWADDAVAAFGPWLMMQIADMANAFESLRNFYEWRVPHRTVISVSIIIAAILILIFTPLELLVKSAGFLFGIVFFGLWPISTNYPDFRLLTSVPKRVFWNIPTNAEWAIKSIQAEGSRQVLKDSSASTSSASSPYGIFTAHFNGIAGHLMVGSSSIQLQGKNIAAPLLNLPYDQINQVEKRNRSIPQIRLDSGKDLLIIDRAGKEWLLENMDERDMAFSQIVGLSDWTWQVMW